jgi:predicted ester cyclase
MGIEENKALVSRWIDEVWNQGKLATIDEIFDPSFTFNYAFPGVTADLEGYKMTVTAFRNAFQEMHITCEEMIAEGDKVAVRWSGRSVHKGEFMGIAPTGKQISSSGLCIDRIVGGKVAEEFMIMDMFSIMQQLGVVPPPK